LKRQQGGGGLMFWGGIGYQGKTNLVLIDGRQNGPKYQRMLTANLLPVSEEISGSTRRLKYTFQQDGASCHTSDSTMRYFQRQQITVLDWPAYSPDMNIIENLWGHMVREVYPGGKVYRNVNQLEVAVQRVWNDIPLEYVQNLFDSMPRRVDELVEARGGPTKY